MNKNELLIAEAIKSLFNQDAELGLQDHDLEEFNSIEHSSEYLHNHISDIFHIKSSELTHSDGINAAFSKVHSYKYIDDPRFCEIMQKNMVGQGIPKHERDKACGFIEQIIKELQTDQKIWAEKDIGFNKELPDILNLLNDIAPENKFDVIDSDLNKGNMKQPPKGTASPSRTDED